MPGRALAMVGVVVLLVAGATTSVPRAGAASTDEIERQLKALQDQINELKKQLEAATSTSPPTPAPAAPTAVPSQPTLQTAPQSPSPTSGNKDIFGIVPSPLEGLKLGAYGELNFGTRQNPAQHGQWQTGFDARRLVLLPSFQFTDSIVFNAEIEFEHAGSGFDADDKLHGTAEIEQAWVDFRVSPSFNIRSPGIDLVPVGYINQHHEPTQFYSVLRPELANGLIPTTWAVPSSSFYGTIVDDLNYQFQISSSLEDFGDDFGKRTDGNRVPPFPAGYAAGIDGKNALAFARAPRGDFRQLSNDLAYAVRLGYTPPFVPGLAGSTSVYVTPNTTPRGAYADTGKRLGGSSLTLIDTEFRYRLPQSGWEFRAEYAQIFFGNPANLRANNDTDPTDNVGRTMYGVSGEVAYHFPLGTFLGSTWKAVPFYRYTLEDLQTSGFRGTDVNAPTGAGKVQFHTVGVAVFPTPKLVLKVTYQRVLDREPGGASSDSVLGSVGFYFY